MLKRNCGGPATFRVKDGVMEGVAVLEGVVLAVAEQAPTQRDSLRTRLLKVSEKNTLFEGPHATPRGESTRELVASTFSPVISALGFPATTLMTPSPATAM